MSNVFARSAAAILMVLSFIALGGAASAQTQRGPAADLIGAWALNKDLSDDAEKVMEKMMSGPGGDHTPPAGVGGGHGPGRHGGGSGSRGGTTPEQMRAMHDVLEAPAKLTIVEGDRP